MRNRCSKCGCFYGKINICKDNSKKGKTYEEIYGIKRANQIKNKISKSEQGKIRTDDELLRQSKTMKKRFSIGNLKINSWNRGLTKETDKRVKNNAIKISKSLMGKKLSKEHRNKLKIWKLGKNKYNSEWAKKISNSRINIIYPTKDSSIEIKIQNFLKELNIDFFTHKYIKDIEHGYQCDIFIPVQDKINQKTIIECDGDWFHCNPNKYNKYYKTFKGGINAEERWELDRIRTKELEEKGYRVIRLWESEIKIIDLIKFDKILEETK